MHYGRLCFLRFFSRTKIVITWREGGGKIVKNGKIH